MKALLIILSFLTGSIPFGIIVSKLFKGEDPRKVGSGNIGATNVARAAGPAAGLITLILDILKGAIPVVIAERLFPSSSFAFLCGLSAIVGHCYSPFLGFNGGKGVATGAGVFMAFNFKAFLMGLLVFATVFATTKIVSLASITSALSMPVWILLLTHDAKKAFITLLVALFITYRHRENIKRLLRKEEPRFSLKKD